MSASIAALTNAARAPARPSYLQGGEARFSGRHVPLNIGCLGDALDLNSLLPDLPSATWTGWSKR